MQVKLFHGYDKPKGWLDPHIACQGLFYYYLIARRNYEEERAGIVLEGDDDPVYNYTQLFSSIALAYNTQPEVMAKFWRNVDMQCWALQLPKMPEGGKYRMNGKAIIRTH